MRFTYKDGPFDTEGILLRLQIQVTGDQVFLDTSKIGGFFNV